MKSCNILSAALSLVSALTFSTALHATPVSDLEKIALGSSHGCGITRDGALRCFGNNGSGELGTEQKLPFSFAKHAITVIAAGATDVAVSDGPINNHSCAVVGGALFCWGSNDSGQLGTGEIGGNIRTPTKASVVSGVVKSVAVTMGSTCVILAANGALQCWGNNFEGSVGGGASRKPILEPITIIAAGVTSVAMGGQHTCAVVDGGLQCWGFLLFKEESFRTELKPISIIPPGQGVTAVAAGLHTCVVVKGSLQCWGRNFHNQVGVAEGSRVAPKVPTTIIASGVTQIAISEENTCAVANGRLMCWGSNNYAQIPNSRGSSIPEAVTVPGAPPATIYSVAIGMRQVCVLTGLPADRITSLLQCSNRAPDPDDVDESEPPTPPGLWSAFGTEGVGFSEPPPALQRVAPYGLWQGTLGTQNVMVQLGPKLLCDARYYYRKHLLSIALVEKDRHQGKLWKEFEGYDNEASWTFSELSQDRRNLTGEWVSKDGKRRFPIRLSLLALTPATVGEDGKPRYECHVHNKAFDAPRIAQAMRERKVAIGATIFQGVDGPYSYHSVAVLGNHIQGLSLINENRTPRLQKVLTNWENDGITGFYDCAFGFSNRSEPIEPDFFMSLAPQFWNARLLVLAETYSNYCGGAHPNGGVSNYIAWDLLEDRPIEAWKWIQGSDGAGHVISKRLRKTLKDHYGRRNETGEESCADALEGQEYFFAYPRATGMVFLPSLPHVIQACADEIEVPWTKMQPYLTPTGKKAVKELIEVP